MAIIIGFPCIGKSTLTRSKEGKDLRLIDLESSCFNDPISGSKTSNWYWSYVFTALDLSEQGYNVFVSSHHEVMLTIIENTTPIIVAPAEDLKDAWVKRAAERFAKDPSLKNYRALQRIYEHYYDDVKSVFDFAIINSAVQPLAVKLTDAAYDLGHLLREALAEYDLRLSR